MTNLDAIQLLDAINAILDSQQTLPINFAFALARNKIGLERLAKNIDEAVLAAQPPALKDLMEKSKLIYIKYAEYDAAGKMVMQNNLPNILDREAAESEFAALIAEFKNQGIDINLLKQEHEKATNELKQQPYTESLMVIPLSKFPAELPANLIMAMMPMIDEEIK